MGRLIENSSIKKRNPNHKIYCEESYAQDMYDKLCGIFNDEKIESKDMQIGQMCKAEVISIKDGEILVQADNTQSVYLDLRKEKRFFEKQGYVDNIKKGSIIDILIDGNNKGTYTGSMEKAFKKNIKKDLMSAMKNKDAAYKVIVKSINDGGFIVDLSGTECFMPGSLAAANKITNFESMIGKEIFVMVENYLEASDIFVVSNKRYIQHILPSKIKELSFSDQYSGTITGTMKYGTFVEWDEIFTGLLHESESIEQDIKSLRPGTKIDFWIKEVKEGGKDNKDIRVILTQKGPSIEHKLFGEFKDAYEGEIFQDARIKDVKPFGIFVELKDGIVGMISPRMYKKLGSSVKEGDYVDVLIKQVDINTKRVVLSAVMDEE